MGKRTDDSDPKTGSDKEFQHVNFRWKPDQIAVVKRAAALAGIPYQSWLKMAVWQAAIEQIKDAKDAGVTE